MNEINFNVEDIEQVDLSIGMGIKEIYPPIENLEVTPTKEQQVFNHENSYGYDNVVVKGVTNEIDSNIQTSNIKNGVTILGVTGTLQEGSSVSVEENTLVFSSGSVEEGELIL